MPKNMEIDSFQLEIGQNRDCYKISYINSLLGICSTFWVGLRCQPHRISLLIFRIYLRLAYKISYDCLWYCHFVGKCCMRRLLYFAQERNREREKKLRERRGRGRRENKKACCSLSIYLDLVCANEHNVIYDLK